MSTGFTMADDVPKIHFGDATIGTDIVPSQAWLDANPEVDGKRPECPAHMAEVRFVVIAHALFPKHTILPPKWPHGEAPCGEIFREPLPVVLRRMQQLRPELQDDIRAVLKPTEEPAE